jgi:DNA-binding GntR family transcriptional regulator
MVAGPATWSGGDRRWSIPWMCGRRRSRTTTVMANWPSETLVDELAELLRERIMDGRMAPGATLSQRQLAVQLSVSRDVVADALRVLRREGLVAVAAPGRALRVVADDDRSMLLSAYAVREVIDGLAARLAAVNAGPALEPTLRACIDDQRQATQTSDRRRYARANLAFHGELIGASGNRLLASYMAIVHATSRAASLVSAERLQRAGEEHESILRAVCRRDGEQSERAARIHVRSTVDALS